MFESFKKSSTSQEPDAKLEGDLAYLSHQKGVKDYRADVDKKSAESYEKDPQNYDGTELNQVVDDERREKELEPEIKEEFERLFKNKTQLMKNFEDSPELLDRIKLLNSEKLKNKLDDMKGRKILEKIFGGVQAFAGAYLVMAAGEIPAIAYGLGGISLASGTAIFAGVKFCEIMEKRRIKKEAKNNLSSDIEKSALEKADNKSAEVIDNEPEENLIENNDSAI